MKKLLILVLCIALCLPVIAGCDTTNSDGKKDKYVIGICQLTAHPALDEATEAFMKEMKSQLGEDKVEFLLQNAGGEGTVCNTIVNDFVSKKVDLIMANGTGALQAAYNATETIPILGTSITEYSVALDLKNFNGTVGNNVSGTSDLAPLTEQAQMIIDLLPEAKKVGLLYCSAEPNSAYQVKVVKEYLEGKGLTVKDFAFSASADVSTVAAAAAAESDVVYIPTDNTAATCAETINSVILPTKTPVFAGEEGICKGCGFATLSISYAGIGEITAKMAAEILRDGKDITKMPIAYDENPVKKYNESICNELGIAAPEGYEKIS